MNKIDIEVLRNLVDVEKVIPPQNPHEACRLWALKELLEIRERGEWTPCTTAYPTVDDEYGLSEPVLVTYLSYYEKEPTVSHAAVYSKTNNEWYWFDGEEDVDDYDRVKVDIVAWMPLPEPYKPQEV